MSRHTLSHSLRELHTGRLLDSDSLYPTTAITVVQESSTMPVLLAAWLRVEETRHTSKLANENFLIEASLLQMIVS